MDCFATASASVKETARRPGRETPHKFTRANHFKGLAALLRNFRALVFR
jgi:hypothetical protein